MKKKVDLESAFLGIVFVGVAVLVGYLTWYSIKEMSTILTLINTTIGGV